LVTRLLIAEINAGRLGTISRPNILLKKGEIAHLEISAQLMKEARDSRRAYGGFTFRIMRGVYYHVGQSQPLTSTHLEVSDSGVLTVTSRRVVYAGDRQSLEMLLAKILAMKVFTDGIEFNLSNRKAAPLFKIPEGFGHVVAATVNAIMQSV
jgi:hypothetical protein